MNASSTPYAFEFAPAGEPRAWQPEAGAVLERHSEADLVARAQRGDTEAMERLVETHTRLVYSIARRYRCRSLALEDLVQEGTVGFIMAVKRFDPGHGCRLSTYATHWIRQAIARAAGYTDRMIHVPAQTHAEIRRLGQIRDHLARELGREPGAWELAEAAGVEEGRVRRLLDGTPEPVSLEALVGEDQDTSLLDLAEDPAAVNPEQGALREGTRQQVRCLVESLRPREREVLEARFGLDGASHRTLEDLSRSMRLTREGVRQIEARAIRKLRHAMRSSQWD